MKAEASPWNSDQERDPFACLRAGLKYSIMHYWCDGEEIASKRAEDLYQSGIYSLTPDDEETTSG